MAIGGEGYLNFMGNEFGHPEWVDFPREGNDWSHNHCRRQWNLADTEYLRYYELNNFDKQMMRLDEMHKFLSHPHQFVSSACEERKLIVAERGPLLFVFNFHPTNTYEDLEVGLGMPGKYRICLDTDAWDFGGQGRVMHDAEHFTQPGGPVTWVGPYEQEPRPCSMQVLSPSRSAQVYFKVPETVDPMEAAKKAAGVSEFPRDSSSRSDGDGGHREFQSQGSGVSSSNATPPQRRQVADPDNVDPDFAPKTGMNAPSFFARDAPPTVGSAEAYQPRPRKVVVDHDNVDPDHGPSRTAAAFQPPPRKAVVDPDNFDPDHGPSRTGGGGGGGGGNSTYQAPKRKEIVDYDNIDPDFR